MFCLALLSCPLYCFMCFSEYRLSEDANPDRAMLVGFELLLARVECYHLLELLEKDQLEPQVRSEIIQPCFIFAILLSNETAATVGISMWLKHLSDDTDGCRKMKQSPWKVDVFLCCRVRSEGRALLSAAFSNPTQSGFTWKWRKKHASWGENLNLAIK